MSKKSLQKVLGQSILPVLSVLIICLVLINGILLWVLRSNQKITNLPLLSHISPTPTIMVMPIPTDNCPGNAQCLANSSGKLIAGLMVIDNNGNAEQYININSLDGSMQHQHYQPRNCTSDPDLPKNGYFDLYAGGLYLYKWEDTTDSLWAYFGGEGDSVGCYLKIDTQTQTINYYPVPVTKFVPSAFNSDRLVIAYNDMPVFYDVNSDEEWRRSHSTVSIYLYYLATKQTVFIDSVPASFVKTKQGLIKGWVSSTELVYHTPNRDKAYILPQ